MRGPLQHKDQSCTQEDENDELSEQDFYSKLKLERTWLIDDTEVDVADTVQDKFAFVGNCKYSCSGCVW